MWLFWILKDLRSFFVIKHPQLIGSRVAKLTLIILSRRSGGNRHGVRSFVRKNEKSRTGSA